MCSGLKEDAATAKPTTSGLRGFVEEKKEHMEGEAQSCEVGKPKRSKSGKQKTEKHGKQRNIQQYRLEELRKPLDKPKS